MNSPEQLLSTHILRAVETLFGYTANNSNIAFQKTNPQFEGDISLVVFPFVKSSGKLPEQTAQLIGEYLKSNVPEVEKFNVVKGFLNIILGKEFWLSGLKEIAADENFGTKIATDSSPLVVVEYSSPNTNKPLHLGHIRNNLLGCSIAQLLAANGNRVTKVNLVNDRGIHICKSMLAWQKFGNGETPESSGMKGDHLVGKYYVEFDKHFKEEVLQLQSTGISKEEAEKKSSLMLYAHEMLLKWESNDPEVIALWKKMNGWVYDGFAITYKKLGVEFDKTYYESQTYLLGKSIVEEGLKKGILHKRDDGAVIIDNTDAGLDQKVLLRSDGTSVYITQDLGTAEERYREFHFDKHIYVVGNEQEYHFKTLKVSLKKLGHHWADSLFHLSYGMVDLPEGKMKSREGTVVDADDLIDEMEKGARALAEEKGMIEGMEESEKEKLSHIVGMAALKYFILKVDPKKKMIFNPKESIDLHGNTGPFMQYTHARIRSIWRKSGLKEIPAIDISAAVHEKEKELIRIIFGFPSVVNEAANNLSPALIANYTYDLAKTFNQFYDVCPVLKEENISLRNFRLVLSVTVARTIKTAMKLLGIKVPEQM
ncbi:MAG: arginine--tRNA ligase [Bacteroidetes bacterium]|nr:arginine--tRNA ligase [Bacteroidota bacterium]